MTRLIKIILMTGGVLFQGMAFASHKSINLYEIPNGPLKKMKMTYQVSYGTCYAHASAALVQYELISKKLSSIFIHPFWLAYLFKKDGKNLNTLRDLNSGSFIDTLTSLKKYKLCDEKTIEKALSKYYERTPQEGIINNFKTILSILDGAIKTCSVNGYDDLLDNANLEIDDVLFSSGKDVNKKTFLKDFRAKLQNGDMIKIVEDVFNVCENESLKVSLPKLHAFNLFAIPKSFWKVRRLIERTLLKKHKPVGITFCANILFEPNFKGVIFEGQRRLGRIEECRSHLVTIVGVRNHRQKREYLIRNSSFLRYGKKINSSRIYDSWDVYTGKNNEELGLWVDAEVLIQNTYALAYFGD